MLSRVGCGLASAFVVALLTVSSAFGQATATYTYDALGRVVTSTTAAGQATYTYDNADNRTHLKACVSTCNHNPVANPDSASVGNGGTAVISVLANDTDQDSGDVLQVTGVGTPVNGKGTTSFTATNVTYVATAGQTGTDSFTYTISDGHGGTAQGTVTMTLSPAPPIANAGSVTVAFNSSNNNVPLNITGGTPTSVAIGTAAGHGTATPTGITISYTPTGGYSGPDSFTYTATNAAGTSAAATISVTVSPAPPTPPTAGNNSANVILNSSNNVMPLVLGGGTATSVAVVSPATHGTATATGGTTIKYTPNTSYLGPDSFTYNATGPGGTSSTATISISVNQPPPIAGANSANVAFNSSNNAMPLVLSGGPATSVTVSRQASHGTATASGLGISYTPTNGYTGPDSFDYTATGPGGTSNAAGISIGVNAPAAPTANAVSMTVNFNSGANPVPINVTGIYNAVGVNVLPSKGSAVVSGATITYQPSTGQSGSDSFFYYASGPGGTGSAAQVSVTINPGPPSLSAPVNTTSYVGSRDQNGWHPGTPVTVTPTGGSGNYSYNWHRVSGDATITVSSSSAATVTWIEPGGLMTFDATTVWVCTVTDNVTAATADSPQISIEIIEDTGQ